MTAEEYLKITERINYIIAYNAPKIEYKQGMENEEQYVIEEFCKKYNLARHMDEDYLTALIAHARKMDGDEFSNNPYLKNIKIENHRLDNFQIINAKYEPGELLVYDMPDMYEDIVVPKLGYFNKAVEFPAVYEDHIPWVSVCPSEINSMNPDIKKAYGNTLVLGLGLGYYPYMIARSPKVKKITIIEKEKKIIDLFESCILPQFEEKDKINIVCADAFEFLESVEPYEYDFCYADIWENQIDGAYCYKKIKYHDLRLPMTDFAYWIERYIR